MLKINNENREKKILLSMEHGATSVPATMNRKQRRRLVKLQRKGIID